MALDIDELSVVDNVSDEQFEVRSDGHVAYLAYERRDGEIDLIHTEVPRELEGHGVAAKLARHALDETRRRGEVAVVYCSYVAAFVEKNAEYEDIVAWPNRQS